MATKREFIHYIVDQIGPARAVTFKSMFGEYALYSDGKLFALVCDNKLFVKPTDSGREYIKDVTEASPYPGAKLCFLIEDKMEDKAWLSELVKITTDALPTPKPKKKKKR